MTSWPRVGVSAVIVKAEGGRAQAVLVRRGKAPFRGVWSLPGGAVELGETLEAAVRREALEETGLDIGIDGFLRHFDLIARDRGNAVKSHFVLATFRARVVGGTLCAGDDAEDAIWADAGALAALPLTPGLADLLDPILGRVTGL